MHAIPLELCTKNIHRAEQYAVYVHLMALSVLSRYIALKGSKFAYYETKDVCAYYEVNFSRDRSRVSNVGWDRRCLRGVALRTALVEPWKMRAKAVRTKWLADNRLLSSVVDMDPRSRGGP